MKRTHALWIGLACLLQLGLCTFITRGVLVDDAYITLRYARNAAAGQGLVYNVGEPVFGVTSPLWGFVTWGLHALFGAWTEASVLVIGVLATAITTWLLADLLPARARTLGLLLFLLAPVFVDNRLLGMETPLVALLLIGAARAASHGSVHAAAAWTGMLLVARPEGLLFAPCLLALLVHARMSLGGQSLRATFAELTRPKALALVLAPGLAWIAYASANFGSIVPQSMVAKSGWKSAHYESQFSAHEALLALPRLSFLPFIDRFPTPLPTVVACVMLAGVLYLVTVNLRRGTTSSRFGVAAYLVYLGFYVLGKGATEASWYSVPSSLLLLVAAGPVLPALSPRVMQLATAALVISALAFARLRAPLLASYVEGYGRCAEVLETLPGKPGEQRVVIGEIGVFGYESRHAITDVGALVSPEVLPWKNAGCSFFELVRNAQADMVVISAIALETNNYPSVGRVWSDETEHQWFEETFEQVAEHRGKLAFHSR